MSEESTKLTRENYGQRGNSAFENEIAQRTAVQDAEFLLPYLKPSMRLLDVGCGPGSITIGLGNVLTFGEVVGIDNQPEMVERARDAAAKAKVENVSFELADCYKLPFPDDSFDACFANSVLQHLSDPVAALAEMRRVLRPGGFAGVRDLEVAFAGPVNSASKKRSPWGIECDGTMEPIQRPDVDIVSSSKLLGLLRASPAFRRSPRER